MIRGVQIFIWPRQIKGKKALKIILLQPEKNWMRGKTFFLKENHAKNIIHFAQNHQRNLQTKKNDQFERKKRGKSRRNNGKNRVYFATIKPDFYA